MPRTPQISIRFAELNDDPTTKRVAAGTTLKAFAEEIGADVKQLYVNGASAKQSYELVADDFIVVVGNIKGGI